MGAYNLITTILGIVGGLVSVGSILVVITRGFTKSQNDIEYIKNELKWIAAGARRQVWLEYRVGTIEKHLELSSPEMPSHTNGKDHDE